MYIFHFYKLITQIASLWHKIENVFHFINLQYHRINYLQYLNRQKSQQTLAIKLKRKFFTIIVLVREAKDIDEKLSYANFKIILLKNIND